MKNVFFTVAFMLLGAFAFAGNEKPVLLDNNIKSIVSGVEVPASAASFEVNSKIDYYGTCYITIGFYNEEGELLVSVTLEITDVPSEKVCNEIAEGIEEILN